MVINNLAFDKSCGLELHIAQRIPDDGEGIDDYILHSQLTDVWQSLTWSLIQRLYKNADEAHLCLNLSNFQSSNN